MIKQFEDHEFQIFYWYYYQLLISLSLLPFSNMVYTVHVLKTYQLGLPSSCWTVFFSWDFSGILSSSASSPTRYCSISSLASEECPTSSKFSVASPPACSSSTSSPPGCWNNNMNRTVALIHVGSDCYISCHKGQHDERRGDTGICFKGSLTLTAERGMWKNMFGSDIRIGYFID